MGRLPVSEPKVHYGHPGEREWCVACGRRWVIQVTRDRSQVTCESCLHTLQYAHRWYED